MQCLRTDIIILVLCASVEIIKRKTAWKYIKFSYKRELAILECWGVFQSLFIEYLITIQIWIYVSPAWNQVIIPPLSGTGTSIGYTLVSHAAWITAPAVFYLVTLFLWRETVKYYFFVITFRIYKICYTYQRLYKSVWRYDDLLFRFFYNADEHILWMFKLFCKKKILNKLIKQLKDKELFFKFFSYY